MIGQARNLAGGWTVGCFLRCQHCAKKVNWLVGTETETAEVFGFFAAVKPQRTNVTAAAAGGGWGHHGGAVGAGTKDIHLVGHAVLLVAQAVADGGGGTVTPVEPLVAPGRLGSNHLIAFIEG